MGYLSIDGVEATLQWISTTYSDFTELISLPESSYEGRTVRALKIAKGGGSRDGVVFLGGVHARELINPDLLLSFAIDTCSAYQEGVSMIYGGQTYTPEQYKLVVESLDVWIVPLVNPDGRSYVQAAGGDPMWRKNRRPTGTCTGIDLNRNFDFLWSSGIGSSSDPCDYQIYRGSSAFSESETRNVRDFLDAQSNVKYLIDVHSYSQDILYSWGDDDDQTTDPSQNFRNPAYDGLRGTPGDTVYREYIDASDLNWYVQTANAVAAAIAAVRGTSYTVKQSVGLYPTTATSDDYSYSRTFANSSLGKVRAYTIETGLEFQPPYSEALNVIAEVSSGLMRFCLACVCPVTFFDTSAGLRLDLEALRTFRDDALSATATGRRWSDAFTRRGTALASLILADEGLRERAVRLLAEVAAAATRRPGSRRSVLSAATVQHATELLVEIEARADAELRSALEPLRRDLAHFAGKPIPEGLTAADKARAKSSDG